MDMTPGFITGFTGILLASAFIRFAVVLTIFRFGLGLKGITFGFIAAALSLTLAMTVLEKDLGTQQVSIFNPRSIESLDVEKTFYPILVKRADPAMVSELKSALSLPTTEEKPSYALMLSAYMLTELKEAFHIGILIVIPFVVVDLIVTNLLVLLGITQLSAAVVSVPIKLLFFFMVNGWSLLAHKLLSGG